MTKNEIIQKHGLEYYEAYKKRTNEHNKKKYQNNQEYAKLRSKKISEYICKRYKEDLEFRSKSNEAHRIRQSERYHSDSAYRESRLLSRSKYKRINYVKDGRLDLIENYEFAKTDNFKGWDIHHRDELRILPSGIKVIRTREELIENDRYYNCPPNELIWMKCSEHIRLHRTFHP